MHFSKGKMETSLGTVFHDVVGDENLFMLDKFNENFLDLVEVSLISPERFFQRNGFQ